MMKSLASLSGMSTVSRMRLQCCPVLIDAVKHDGRDREDHTWWCKFSLGENVVDKAAVQAAVPILERMNINEPEGRGCGLQDRIDLVGNHAIVCFKQCRHQVGKISGPRTDEFGQRIAVVISLA